MKNILLTMMICLTSIQIMAQIEMFEGKNKKENIDSCRVINQPYDSLSNFKSQRNYFDGNWFFSFHHLIGQTLLYCGEPYYSSTNKNLEVGSYYRFDGIPPFNPKKNFYKKMLLTNVATGEQLEGGDLSDKKINYQWLVVGYYEKIKQLYLNKEFVYMGEDDVQSDSANDFINLETDEVVENVTKETIWTCVGVQVKPRKVNDGLESDYRSPIVLIFDNPSWGKHYCYFENSQGTSYKGLHNKTVPYICGRFWLKSDYEKVKFDNAKRKTDLTKKYGAKNAELILEGKVSIGMTKTMCEEAWGKPINVNTTILSGVIHEQWVYGGGNYLYFEGNKLTAIQN